MNQDLQLFNHWDDWRVDLRLLRRVALQLLAEFLDSERFDLTIHLVHAAAMTRLNETRLGHAGSTDVITFDYSDAPGSIVGELFICTDEARIQATRFKTTWQSELVRYLVHGLLHLQGFDDLHPAERRKMKRREDRLLREIALRFDLRKLERRRKLAA